MSIAAPAALYLKLFGKRERDTSAALRYSFLAIPTDDGDPWTGGHHDDLAALKRDALEMLDRFDNVERIVILDAMGQYVWHAKQDPKRAPTGQKFIPWPNRR